MRDNNPFNENVKAISSIFSSIKIWTETQKKNDTKINKYPPIINECYSKGGKKAYIKPSMELYPFCDEILGSDANASGKLIAPEYGGDLYEQD